MITLDLVESAQKKWGEGIVKIGSLKNNFKLCKEFTSSFLNETYSFKEVCVCAYDIQANTHRPNCDHHKVCITCRHTRSNQILIVPTNCTT